MSEVQSRPSAPRGRSSARGGRAGFGSRGGRGGRGHATNGDKAENIAPPIIEDESEVGQLKKKYGSKVSTVKELFPEWTDEDAVFALQETDGDLEVAVGRITDGTITQWGEVSKNKKDRSRPKAKDTITTTLGEPVNGPRPSRSARSAHEGGRGARGRGNERGRGGRSRGGSANHTNGGRTKEISELSVPTDESHAWDAKPNNHDVSEPMEASKESNSWGAAATDAAALTTATAAKITSSVIPDGVKKSWASMFKPTLAPAPKKEPSPVQKGISNPVPEPTSTEPELIQSEEAMGVGLQDLKTSLQLEEVVSTEATSLLEPEVSITPSRDELTETNLEQVLDTSNPPLTATQASTAASSWDPRSGANSTTPYSALQTQQPHAIRPPTSGYAASALKATNSSGRTQSYQRRLLDQEEAVRMPGNREVDRAAVQFGAFNLNEMGDEDVDGDREEPETRAQPPQHSPVAHPRAALPPAPTQSTGSTERLPSPGVKDAGLPATTHSLAAPGLPSPNPLPGAQNMSQQGSQGSQPYSQYGRYQQSGAQEQSSFGQKAYDPFSQQGSSPQGQFEGYPSQQNSSQPQSSQPAQTQPAAFTSAPSDYSSYYTTDQHRNALQNYYGQQYNQQQTIQPGSDGPNSQQRAFSGYNAPQVADNNTPFPQTSGQQTQARYTTVGEAQTSGHSTPNPPAQAQQPGQTAQAPQTHPSQPQGPTGQYPYNHPYYSSPYYSNYINQHYQGYNQGSYAGPYGNAKAGMYNQPHQGYGISPQTPYDHSASPGIGGFGQTSLHGRDTALGAGLADYARAGSQPSPAAQPLGGTGPFGGLDAFGRGSSYQGQGSHYAQQNTQPGSSDDLKPFVDGKSANGPSPLLSQAVRPGSAANSTPGQTGLPPVQSTQQGYAGYPNHLPQQHALHGSQTGSQYGSLGGVGGHQAAGQGHQGHQGSQYGAYGQGFGGNSYYGNNQQRGGWGNNYGH